MMLTYAGSFPIERVTKGRLVIDSNHGQVHDKNAYEFWYSAQLAPAGVMALGFTVPAAAYVHFQAAKLLYGGGIKFEVFEGATFANGTEVIPPNKHRINPPASVLSIKKNIDTIAGGLDLLGGPVFLGTTGTNARSSFGGNTGDTSEWVWKPTQTYVFRITSLEPTLKINVAISPFWYEEGGA